ncbi:hypothetical protein E2C01_093086 [Portunus trituberculatus]|uniref:Uncharacterized protein n=1 Tax=Portunus trituberculatus TaxID=210409 RepID=A0A5B7JX77_PORTR|nr:hypothetical protein [Portunus trituberculatus]
MSCTGRHVSLGPSPFSLPTPFHFPPYTTTTTTTTTTEPRSSHARSDAPGKLVSHTAIQTATQSNSQPFS